MERLLVTFEIPDTDLMPGDPDLLIEKAWDSWVQTLSGRGIELVADLDPVAVVGRRETYEATFLDHSPEKD